MQFSLWKGLYLSGYDGQASKRLKTSGHASHSFLSSSSSFCTHGLQSFFLFVCLFRLSMMSLNARYAFFFFFPPYSRFRNSSANACFLSAPTMGGLLGPRCLQPEKREFEPMKNTYPWKHLCLFPGLYGVFITTSWQHWSKVRYLFFLSLRARYSSAPMGLLGSGWVQAQVQDILLRGNRKLIWFIPDPRTTQELFSWSKITLSSHLEVEKFPGWMELNDCVGFCFFLNLVM